jgi:hypothetical protein
MSEISGLYCELLSWSWSLCGGVDSYAIRPLLRPTRSRFVVDILLVRCLLFVICRFDVLMSVSPSSLFTVCAFRVSGDNGGLVLYCCGSVVSCCLSGDGVVVSMIDAAVS